MTITLQKEGKSTYLLGFLRLKKKFKYFSSQYYQKNKS